MDLPALVMPAHQTGATRRMKNRVGIGVRQPPILPHHELLSSQVSQRHETWGTQLHSNCLFAFAGYLIVPIDEGTLGVVAPCPDV
jgi:hypothetical protein